jgi:hypothetical protein
MHKNATKCNETLSKWCKNKHGASKIIDMFEMYHCSYSKNASRNKACFEGRLINSYVDLICYSTVFMKYWTGLNSSTGAVIYLCLSVWKNFSRPDNMLGMLLALFKLCN